MSSEEGVTGHPRMGGQAIIEGVMMRSPECLSAAVRLQDGKIKSKIWPGKTWHTRNKFTGWPIIRGTVSLVEALVLGLRTLNWSADIALEQEKGKKKKSSRRRDAIGLTASLILAVILAVVIFMLVPYELANLLKTGENQPLFHLVAGTSRIVLFLAYIWAISLMKDIRRVFQYHGAEHQAIFTYEKRLELSPDNARNQSCLHPRCGTSFLLIVALLTMAIFVVFDILVVAIWGSYPNVFIRLLVHLPFLPIVAGMSYEFLRLSDRFSSKPLFRALIAPGLALQKITTRKPDDDQREIALHAIKIALSQGQSVEPVGAEK